MEHKPEYDFYVADNRGKYRSIHGTPASLVKCSGADDFRKNLAIHSHVETFESDIKPVFKILSRHYHGAGVPKLNIAYFDIETNFDPQRGYAHPSDAFMDISAIAVYLSWCDTMVCLAVPPPTLTWEQAEIIATQVPGVILCKSEAVLLSHFLELIQDSDVLTGWNSTGYDIPYTVNRVIKTLGKQRAKEFCLWNVMPQQREYDRHGKTEKTYALTGRVHLDYMELYINYNYEERHSYALDYIAEIELGERKVEYQGSLDQLYHHDFLLFLKYNIKDTYLVYRLDQKLQFIDLANTIAHDNTVLLPTTMGSVATTEQAIINEAHRRGMIVPDRKRQEKDTKAAGAYVADPMKGYHEWIGSMDINSLYPSVFRVLNMGPETIVGQVSQHLTEKEIMRKTQDVWQDEHGKSHKPLSFSDAWHNKFSTVEYELVAKKDTQQPIKLYMESGEILECTGADVYNLVFNSGQNWIISANGTIFKSPQEFYGIIPGLLETWYNERQVHQKRKQLFQNIRDGWQIPERLIGDNHDE